MIDEILFLVYCFRCSFIRKCGEFFPLLWPVYRESAFRVGLVLSVCRESYFESHNAFLQYGHKFVSYYLCSNIFYISENENFIKDENNIFDILRNISCSLSF
jgi:hypothetical protein